VTGQMALRLGVAVTVPGVVIHWLVHS
jgi:hypothetical protein